MQPFGEATDPEAVDGHRADDEDEHQRHQLLGLGGEPGELVGLRRQGGRGGAGRVGGPLGEAVGGVAQLEREDAGHRGGDDPARCHAGEQGALLAGDVGAEQAETDADRSHDEHQCHQEQQCLREYVVQLLGGDPAGEHDEQRADQEHLQMLLELADVLEVQLGPVAEDHAEHGDREQAALLLQQVGQEQGADGRAEEDHPVQEVGDGVAAHQPFQRGGERDGDAEADDGGAEQAERHGRQCLVHAAGEDRLEDEHGEDRADRVDDDALPAQEVRHPAGRPQRAQDRRDHGGAGDHQDGADQQGDGGVEADQQRGPGDQHPGDEHGDGAQSRHGAAQVGDLADPQRQAALEQDDAHGQAHPAEEHVAAEHLLGAHHLAEAEADQQEDEDRGDVPLPRGPLADHGEHDDQRHVRPRRHAREALQHARSAVPAVPPVHGSQRSVDVPPAQTPTRRECLTPSRRPVVNVSPRAAEPS